MVRGSFGGFSISDFIRHALSMRPFVVARRRRDRLRFRMEFPVLIGNLEGG
jgi:hypothetical protein